MNTVQGNFYIHAWCLIYHCGVLVDVQESPGLVFTKWLRPGLGFKPFCEYMSWYDTVIDLKSGMT